MPTALARWTACVALVGILTACGPGGDDAPTAGPLPSSGHVHALRVAGDGSLLLGLHGGLWRSEDGAAWLAQGLQGQDAMALGVAVDGAPLVVGGHDVLARSTDGGQSFEDLRPDLPSLDIHALAQAPANPDLVYAFVVGVGLHVSDDAGDTWTMVAPVGQVPADLATMAVSPDDTSTILVGSPGEGVLRSTDGGTTFAQVMDMGAIGVAHGEGGRALAATIAGVLASDDGGQTWQPFVSPDDLAGQAIAVAAGTDGTAWVVTDEARAVYRVAADGVVEEVARA